MKRNLVVAMILALSSVSGFAAEPPKDYCCSMQQKQTDSGIPYISGGIGEDERTALNAAAADYNLKLVFADKGGGHLLSDIKVSITGAKGASVLEAVSDGPWFFAKLPPGAYKVSATAGDQNQTHSVSVGKKRQSRVAFSFQAP